MYKGVITSVRKVAGDAKKFSTIVALPKASTLSHYIPK